MAGYEVPLNCSFCPQGCQLHSAACYMVTLWHLENCHILQSPLQYSKHMLHIYIFTYAFLPILPYIFRCVIHHPQGKFSILAQNLQLFTGLLHKMHYNACGPGSSVGIATELRAGRSGIESRWGRDFPPVQTGPGTHPASCTMDTVSFPGVNCGRGVLLTTHPLLVLRSWKSRAIPLPTLCATPGL